LYIALKKELSAQVAGSYDRDGFKYRMLYDVQGSREEKISNIGRMIKALVLFFKEKNGRFPTKMYYYRDGISEGMFEAVMQPC